LRLPLDDVSGGIETKWGKHLREKSA